MSTPEVARACNRAMAARSSRQRGFSLLELLVALIVVVLITSMVTLAVNSGGQDIRLEAQVRNLADVASYSLDEAQMTGRTYGLLLEEVADSSGDLRYGWRWQERRLEGWREPELDVDLFEPQRLPPDISLELELEEGPLTQLTLDGEEEITSPQVVFYASGETTVGAINFRNRDSGDLLWRLEWDLLGRFELLLRGEPLEEDL